ncbi:MAG: flagellar basal body P-ring formation chaperone FlgA [Candidatus Kapaibacterium sp.]
MRNNIYIILAILIAAIAAASGQSTFPADRLEEAMLNYCRSNFGEAEYRIERELSDEIFKMSGVVAKIHHLEDFSGEKEILSLEFYTDTRLLKRIKTPVSRIVYAEVPVAARNIRPGEAISHSDINIKRIESARPNSNALAPEMIAGRTADRAIRSGDVISESDLEKEVLINHGQSVTINVIAGAVRIRALGSALSDAAAGDVVRVRRNGDGTILQGVAAADGSVIISNHNYFSTAK